MTFLLNFYYFYSFISYLHKKYIIFNVNFLNNIEAISKCEFKLAEKRNKIIKAFYFLF